jgi:hypothetical protein
VVSETSYPFQLVNLAMKKPFQLLTKPGVFPCQALA